MGKLEKGFLRILNSFLIENGLMITKSFWGENLVEAKWGGGVTKSIVLASLDGMEV